MASRGLPRFLRGVKSVHQKRLAVGRDLTRGRCTIASPALASVQDRRKLIQEADQDFFNISSLTSVEELFHARVHLGHKAGAWNPLMKDYILGTRAGVHILDLDQTLTHLTTALSVAAGVAYRRGIVLFVNERPQFEVHTQAVARACRQYFVAGSWQPGTFTNSHKLLQSMRLPDLVLFFSVPASRTAIKETLLCALPSVGLVDTDSNPKYLTYPVPANDDTPCSVRLMMDLFARAVLRGKQKLEEEEQEKKQDPKNQNRKEQEDLKEQDPKQQDLEEHDQKSVHEREEKEEKEEVSSVTNSSTTVYNATSMTPGL